MTVAPVDHFTYPIKADINPHKEISLFSVTYLASGRSRV